MPDERMREGLEGACLTRGPWRSITTAPTDGTAVLILDMDAPAPAPVVAHCPEDADGVWLGGYPEDWDRDPIRAGMVLGEYLPTHWMPPPPPPQGAGGAA